MSLRISCPECKSVLKVAEKYAGRTVACVKCQTPLRVPELPPAAASVEGTNTSGRPPRPAAVPRPASLRPSRPVRQPAPDGLEDLAAESGPVGKRSDRSLSGSKGSSKRKDEPSARARPLVIIGAAIAASISLLWLSWFLLLRPANLEVARGSERLAESLTAGLDKVRQPPAARPEVVPADPQTKAEPALAPAEVRLATTGTNSSSPMKAPIGAKASSENKEATGQRERSELPLEELIERVGNGVVLIKTFDRSGREAGLGSGFVIDASGLIATCFHVVQRADRAVVEFRDGQKFDVVGSRQLSPQADLAILELAKKPSQLTVLKLAASAPLRLGQEVIAIGHPSGLTFTPTRGMVNGVHKTSELPADARRFLSLRDTLKDEKWVQTDAIISPGNSGGPLMNRQGEVVGINSWVSMQTRFAFAVHVQHLAELQEQLYAKAEPLSATAKKFRPTGGPFSGLDPKVDALFAEYLRAAEEYSSEVDAFPAGNHTRAEREALLHKNPATPFANRFLDLANDNRETKIAFQSLRMVFYLLPSTEAKSRSGLLKRVSEPLLEDHIENPELGNVALLVTVLPLGEGKTFLREIIKRSPHRQTQAYASVALATVLLRQVEEKPTSRSSAAADRESVTLLKRVIHDFGDVQLRDRPITEFAKPLLAEAEGRKGPDGRKAEVRKPLLRSRSLRRN